MMIVREIAQPLNKGSLPNPPRVAPPSSTERSALAQERVALTFALAAVLLWSTVATAFKLGLRELAPVQLLFLACIVSLVFFVSCAVVQRRVGEIFALPARTLAGAAALGLLNPFLYYIVLFEAYRRLPAQIAQPLNYTWAVTLALLAVPLLRQALTRRDIIGILVSYAGVVILLSARGGPTGDLDPIGVALALGSTVIWAGYWLASVRLTLHPVVSMTIGFATATVAIGLACAATAGLPVLTAERLAFGAWVGLVEMGITFLLWREALGRTRHAARIAQLIFLSPFLSFVLIATFVGEPIRATSVIGLAAIVAGLLITRRR
jgi:drug/metabolite transporter (DMT)-like permease